MSGCSLANENEEVRAATCSPLILESELSSSSVSPSEKYSCSLSPLIFTNGSTAMECGGGLKAAGNAGDDVAPDVAGSAACFEIHGLLMSRYASAATISTATTTGRARLNVEGRLVVREIGDEPDA